MLNTILVLNNLLIINITSGKMERTLQIKDFLDFDKLFKNMKIEILEKHAEGKLINEDLV
jgi:hypothetical protein